MTRIKPIVAFFSLLLAAHILAQATAKPPAIIIHTASSWQPQLAQRGDSVMLRGTAEQFAERAQSWQQKGYAAHALVNIAWGDFMDYITGVWDGKSHFDEIQTGPDSLEIEHAGGGYYLTPSETHLAYLKQKISRAIDAGAASICLEQPFMWSKAGYGDGFKREWESFYQTEWQAPAASMAAQFHSERLKYELGLRAVSSLLSHAKTYAQSRGREVQCYVATSSHVQSAAAGKVGPQAELLYVPECDGLIGEVEPEVKPTQYAGITRPRPFETAWLGYGIFTQSVRTHDKTLAFAFDLSRAASWEERERILEAQALAALFYPACSRYEFNLRFDELFVRTEKTGAAANGGHALTTSSTNGGAHVLSEAEAVALQTLIFEHAVQNMPQAAARWEAGERGIGILTSDALMLQRVALEASDSTLASFYGIALPLIKHGIYVEPLAMENLLRPNYLVGYKIIFSSYRYMKPQQAKWHERLATWVKTGGTLIFIDDEKDAFNHAPGWWREEPNNFARPSEHLFQALGLNNGPELGRNKAGMGTLLYVTENPVKYAHSASGPDSVLALLDSAMPHGRQARRQNYFKLHHGPYVLAAAFDETTISTALRLRGDWLDLFDVTLPRISEKHLAPGEQAFLLDLTQCDSTKAQVLAGSAKITNEQRNGARYTFTARGPARLLARLTLYSPNGDGPVSAQCGRSPVPIQKKSAGKIIWLEFEQQELPVEIILGE